jgi:hypothetical protein
MKINLQIQFEDGKSKDITCNAADLVAFEDRFDVSVSKLAQESKLGHLLFLAWHSEQRTNGTTLAYNEWLESVAGVGEDTADPK